MDAEDTFFFDTLEKLRKQREIGTGRAAETPPSPKPKPKQAKPKKDLKSDIKKDLF